MLTSSMTYEENDAKKIRTKITNPPQCTNDRNCRFILPLPPHHCSCLLPHH